MTPFFPTGHTLFAAPESTVTCTTSQTSSTACVSFSLHNGPKLSEACSLHSELLHVHFLFLFERVLLQPSALLKFNSRATSSIGAFSWQSSECTESTSPAFKHTMTPQVLRTHEASPSSVTYCRPVRKTLLDGSPKRPEMSGQNHQRGPQRNTKTVLKCLQIQLLALWFSAGAPSSPQMWSFPRQNNL